MIVHQLPENAGHPRFAIPHTVPDSTVGPVPDYLVDARGLYCPEPVMLLHNAVRDTQPGQRITLLATDPSTRRDVPKFCQFLGHELLGVEEAGDTLTYRVCRGAARE